LTDSNVRDQAAARRAAGTQGAPPSDPGSIVVDQAIRTTTRRPAMTMTRPARIGDESRAILALGDHRHATEIEARDLPNRVQATAVRQFGQQLDRPPGWIQSAVKVAQDIDVSAPQRPPPTSSVN